MLIKKLRISNDYRRFHDLTINLGDNPKRIIALVGPNGCGKSSVFDALIYHNREFSGDFGAYDGYGGAAYHFREASEINNQGSVEIIFNDERSFVEVWQERGQSGNTIFSFRSSYRYNNVLNVGEIRAVVPIELNNVGAATASSIDQRMEDNYRRLLAKYQDYLNSNDCKPSEARAHIVGELNDAISKCLSIEIVNLGNIEEGRGSLYFKKSDQEKEFSFDVLSSGEKEVVDILVDLYLRKDIFKNSVFLLDEPELHINTAIQRKLMVEINKMIDDNCQIWIATHSLGLLRALQDELNDVSDIIRFDENTEWAREPIKLVPMPKTRKDWQKIFFTMLDDMTALLSPRQIVYCEGRDRPAGDGSERGFDAKVYNTIFEGEYPDTLFVSSGGNTELDQRSDIAIAIIGKALPKTEILILKDRDMASGKSVSEVDRQEYLNNNPDHHRVLGRFEIENYLFDKAVLKKYCESLNREFNEAAYNDLALDIVNDNIKERWKDIKNVCGTVANVSKEIFLTSLAAYLTPELPVYAELKSIIFTEKDV